MLDYSARRLDAARAANLERHVENCAAVRGVPGTEQTAVWDALDAWEPTPVSMDFNRRLWQRIDAIGKASWFSSLADALRMANWKPVFPLAAAVLVIAGGFLLDHPGDKTVAPGVAVQGVSTIEADQLEQTLDDIQLLRQLDPVTAPGGAPKQM